MRTAAVLAACLTALIGVPGAAVARPRAIAHTGRIDFGPAFVGRSSVLIATARRVVLVSGRGRETTLHGVRSPPKGALMAATLNTLAWQTTTDRPGPGAHLERSVGARIRIGLPGRSSELFGGFRGAGTRSGRLATCTPLGGHRARRLVDLAVSTELIAYVAEEPPRECPQARAGVSLKLIAHPIIGYGVGPERVVAVAHAPAPGAAEPFTDLRVARGFVAWMSPDGDGSLTATVDDQWFEEPEPYQLTGLHPNGFALDEGAGVVVGLGDGTAAWASPDEPTLHVFGAGRPWTDPGNRTAILQHGRTLVWQPFTSAGRTLVTLRRGERFVGTVASNGLYATWATRRRVCLRGRCRPVVTVMRDRLPPNPTS